MFNMVAGAHYSRNTSKQQTVPSTAAVITPPTLGDAVVKPESIFLQALSTNTESIFVGFTSGVTAGGAGIELPAGANINLPSLRYGSIYVISASGGQALNIVYSEGAE